MSTPNNNNDELYDVTMNNFSCVLLGPRGVGKSYFIRDLLLSELITTVPERVIWVSGSTQEDYINPLREKYKDRLNITESCPDFEDMQNCLIIIDDMAVDLADSPHILKAFQQGRHKNITILMTFQNIFTPSKHMKSIVNNSDYIVLFGSFRARSQVKTLAQQIYQNQWKFLFDSYLDALKKNKFGHILLDNRSKCPEEIRVRSNTFDKYPEINVYVPKNIL